MANEIVLVEGEQVPVARAAVALDSRGLTVGDGLFETIAFVDGAPVALERHLARLAAGCRTLDIPLPSPFREGGPDSRRELVTQLRRLLDANRLGGPGATGSIRLTVVAGTGPRGLDRGPAVPSSWWARVAGHALGPPAAGMRLAIIRDVPLSRGDPLTRVKSISRAGYVLARRLARARGADEALLLDETGHVACAAAANVVLAMDGRLVSPTGAVLAGTMRDRVLEHAAACGRTVELRPVSVEELHAAGEVMLTNALKGVVHVAAIDGQVAGVRPGPVCLEARGGSWPIA